MCGIAGYTGTAFSAMDSRVIAHRGPDDSGEWSDLDAGVRLFHRRLSIIDLSPTGHQPMTTPDGRFVMVYNGEIYNYRALRAELEARGETFFGTSDSEVLLRLFARDGRAAFTRMNGIFSVAIWDRSRRELTLVRDPMGVKPLYYQLDGGSLAFASEFKTILLARKDRAEVDTTAALHHLAYLWSPGERTIAKGVKKLKPGWLLVQRDGEVVEHSCYLDPLQPAPESEMLSRQDAVAAVRREVEAAVDRQMVADVPVGAFLSGGLDSSAVAAFASRRTGSARLQCFTIEAPTGVEAGFIDDLPFAQRVAVDLDVDLHTVPATDDMMDRLPDMIWGLDEPTADPAAINTLLISELAREQGITVLLSGTGGDDIFTGYRRHLAFDGERFWGGLPRPIRRAIAGTARALPVTDLNGRRLNKALRYAGLEPDERLASYFFWLDPKRTLALLRPEARAGLTEASLFEPLLNSLDDLPDDTAGMDRLLYLEGKHFLADHNLNYTDKMGMAAGVEVRTPLLDLDLVALSRRIQPSDKLKGTTAKWVFKAAMADVLPHDVIHRAKSGFGVPLRHWLKGALAPLVDELLSDAALARGELFDPVAVRRLIDDDRAGRVDAAYSIFAVLCIALWTRQFVTDLRAH